MTDLSGYTEREREIYQQGRTDEYARQRENVAGLIASLLAQFADIQIGFMRVAQQSREQRVRTEMAAMIVHCHRIAKELGRPRGYRWLGTERGDTTAGILDADGDWSTSIKPKPRQDAA
jgi:hypothetical protein